MRTTIGVLGVVGLGMSVALGQTGVVPAGGVLPNAGVIPAGATVPNSPPPAQAGGVIVPSMPSADDSAPLSRGLGKIRSAFTSQSQAANAPNANSPFQTTTPNGSTVYAGPPAYRWYGWGTVTPGANPSAPNGQYPKASANWYSITGATPGAFPTPVIGGQAVQAGPEPPSYATASTRTPDSYAAPPAPPATPATGGAASSQWPPPTPTLVQPPPVPPQAAVAPPPSMMLPPPHSLASPLAPAPSAPAPPAAPGLPSPATPSSPNASAAPPSPALPALADPAIPNLKSHLPPGPVPELPIATLPPPAGLTAPPNTLHPPAETMPPPLAPSGSMPMPITPPPAIGEPANNLRGEMKPLDTSAIPPPSMTFGPTTPLGPTTPVAVPQGPTAVAGPAPAALPVSVTDYSLNWQPTKDRTGQWKGEGIGSQAPAPLPKADGPQMPAPAPPLSAAPAPLPVLPASAPVAAPTPAVQPTPMPTTTPMPPMPPPDWQQPGATETSQPRTIARGQVGQPGPDPMVALVRNVCAGRAEGVDVRYTGTKRLSVCFECRTAEDAKRLVRDISARPELIPYRIDFCVLVK